MREKDKERMCLRAGIIYVYRKPLNLVVEGDNVCVCVCAPWDVTLSTKSNTYIFNGDRGQSSVSFIETESNYCRLYVIASESVKLLPTTSSQAMKKLH